MSKHETWRTRLYWKQVGGLLIEEFLAIRSGKQHGKRQIDGLIVLNEKNAIYPGNSFDIEGKDVIVVQTKAGRIGMYLLGQAYFSKLLVKRLKPRSIRSVAICGKNDEVMQDIARTHEVEVVVIPDSEKRSEVL